MDITESILMPKISDQMSLQINFQLVKIEEDLDGKKFTYNSISKIGSLQNITIVLTRNELNYLGVD